MTYTSKAWEFFTYWLFAYMGCVIVCGAVIEIAGRKRKAVK